MQSTDIQRETERRWVQAKDFWSGLVINTSFGKRSVVEKVSKLDDSYVLVELQDGNSFKSAALASVVL